MNQDMKNVSLTAEGRSLHSQMKSSFYFLPGDCVFPGFCKARALVFMRACSAAYPLWGAILQYL